MLLSVLLIGRGSLAVLIRMAEGRQRWGASDTTGLSPDHLTPRHHQAHPARLTPLHHQVHQVHPACPGHSARLAHRHHSVRQDRQGRLFQEVRMPDCSAMSLWRGSAHARPASHRERP